MLRDLALNFSLHLQDTPVPVTLMADSIISLHADIMNLLIIFFVVIGWLLAKTAVEFTVGGNQYHQVLFSQDEVFNQYLKDIKITPYIFAKSTEEEVEENLIFFPTAVLGAIVVPSLSLIYAGDELLDSLVTVKAVGNQWYWTYEYGSVDFESVNMYWDLFYNVKEAPNHLDFDIEGLGQALTNGLKNGPENTPIWYRKYRQRVRTPIAFNTVPFETESRLFDPNNFFYKVRTLKVITDYVTLPSNNYAVLLEGASALTKVRLATLLTLVNRLDEGHVVTTLIPPKAPYTPDTVSLLYRKTEAILEATTPLILPVGVNIKLIVTSNDVIHSWGVPQFGIKIDAIPGRLNTVNLFIETEGVYYGQCYELCGPYHGYMPIKILAVDLESFLFYLFANKHNG